FCAWCSVFSRIDQNGTVTSVHRLEGWVSRKFPSPVSSQSFGAPAASRYGAITRRRSLTASTLNVKRSDVVQNQMSSLALFHVASAPVPFPRSHVMRLRTMKCSDAASKMDADVSQSPQT